jgi:hypothetical protein
MPMRVPRPAPGQAFARAFENACSRTWLAVMVALAAWLASGFPVHAHDGPLRVRSLAPMALPYGLPRMAGGELLREGYELTFMTELANNFFFDQDGPTLVAFDGETAVISYGYRRAIGERMEWQLEIPYVVHFGGYLDGAIDGFHNLLGISDRGREDLPRYRLEYVVGTGDQVHAEVRRRARRFGDVRVGFGYAVLDHGDRALAARVQLKLPTGHARALTGSDAADLAAWLDYTDRRLLERFGMTLTAGAGLVGLGEGELLPDRQRRTVWVTQLGLAYPFTENLSGRVQVDVHQRLFSTEVRQLGVNAVLGSFGLRWRVYPRLWTDLLIAEELRSYTSSDVTFQLMLGASL